MNQHYVPRLYLKHFSEKRGKEFFVDVYDKESKRTFNTNIKNICAEKDIYTLDEDSNLHPDSFVFEKLYAEWIEPLYEKAYNILTNDKIFRITTKERIEIITGILQLYYRNSHILTDTLIKLRSDIKNQFLNTHYENEGFTYLSKYFRYKDWNEESVIQFFVKELTKEYKEKHILETQRVIDYQKYAKFEVAKIIDNGTFITSDNPLSIDDIINPTRNPLLKSKEFIIPLNQKYALKIFHDNTKELNLIYRIGIPHGNANSINTTLDEQCIRFLIGQTKSFEQYFYISNFVNNLSLDYIIDVLRQIIEKFPVTNENKESHNVLRHYIEKYDREGTLNINDQHQLQLKLNQLSIKAKKSKI